MIKIPTIPIRWLIVSVVLFAAAILGSLASTRLLFVVCAVFLGVVLLYRPLIGLLLLIPVSLLVKVSIGTGTEVDLAPAVLLLPVIIAIFILTRIRMKALHFRNWRVNLPMALLLLSGLVSLIVGNVLWDPTVPRSSNFILVQLAQWSIFALSAGAFWLVANLIDSEKPLKQFTVLFIVVGGIVASLYLFPPTQGFVLGWFTVAVTRASFWLLLSAIVAGQLFFNGELKRGFRIFLVVLLLVTIYYAFIFQRESASNWVGVGASLVVIAWFRWPRARWFAIFMLLLLIATGLLFPAVWNFAGGEAEWITSGGSRLVLIERVLEDTIRNPITGLGPAAYRAYGATRPLPYQRAFWVVPAISSHNNYVDIFSHFGLIGLSLFIWFVVEVTRLGLSLRKQLLSGFAAGYANGMLAAGAGALAAMMLADWILPFVYNIGFPGFQASLVFWLFLGGLVALNAFYPKTTSHYSIEASSKMEAANRVFQAGQ